MIRSFIIAFVLLTPCVAYGDNITLDNYPNFQNQAPLNFDFNYSHLEIDLFNYLSYCDYTIPGSTEVEYTGLYDIVLTQFERRVKSEVREDLRTEYELTNMNISTFNARMALLCRDPPGPYGEWWERPWYRSFSPENGGAPLEPYRIEIGLEVNVPKWVRPYWWIKSQIENLGDIWLGIEDDFEVQDGSNPRRLDARERNNEIGRLETPSPSITVEQADRWFSGESYHFRFRPSIRFKPEDGIEEFINELSLKFQIELYIDQWHFANINAVIEYNMPEENFFFSCHFELTSW